MSFLRDIAVWVKFNEKQQTNEESFGFKLLLIKTNYAIDITRLRQWIAIPKEPLPTSTEDFKIIKQPENQVCILNQYLIESKRLFIDCTKTQDIEMAKM